MGVKRSNYVINQQYYNTHIITIVDLRVCVYLIRSDWRSGLEENQSLVGRSGKVDLVMDVLPTL